MNILFRCDGSHEIGLGHVVRCMALADELKEVHGCRVTFAMRNSDLGKRIVSGKYDVIYAGQDAGDFDYRQWLQDILKQSFADILVLDVRDGLKKKDLGALKTANLLVVDIDDPEEKRLSADLVFYPPVPQTNFLDWTGFTGNAFVGWEWVILRKEFHRKTSGFTLGKPDIFKILVTMGGSDPMDMTVKALNALRKITAAIEITLILGKGFAHRTELEKVLPEISHPVDIKESVENMASVMGQMDLAVASFGMTAYELAAMGVPAVYLCISPDHLKSAESFIKSRLAYYAWPSSGIESDDFLKALTACIGNNYLKKQMRQQTPGIIDGLGAKRIAVRIMMHQKCI
jgi:UDP-2,4-diacetamido-2,4,6-trideoxy-beta-L-altropyranose hydrolase